MSETLLAIAAAGAVALIAWRLDALDAGGALAATVVGSTVLALAGLGAALVLVAFFVSSSALSLLRGRGGRARRNARQVMANGSVAAVLASLHGIVPLADVALLGAVAAAAADTWATEIGMRLGRRPRSILTFRHRPPGTSGAISLPGTAAALVAASAVAALGAALVVEGWTVAVAVAIGGVLGALIDSVLGAAVQAEFHCPTCDAKPEVARHEGCPSRARRTGGLPGIDNDAVNWFATAIGAAAAAAISLGVL